MASPFVKLSADFHASPAGRQAGRLGREVFILFICRQALVDGPLSDREAASWYLAEQLMVSEDEASLGLQLAIAAGLVRIDRGRVLLSNDGCWASQRPRAVSTYAIEADGRALVKVGKTIDVARRMSELQTASPSHLRLLGHVEGDVESELHRALHAHHHYGEWFSLNDEVLAILRARGVF